METLRRSRANHGSKDLTHLCAILSVICDICLSPPPSVWLGVSVNTSFYVHIAVFLELLLSAPSGQLAMVTNELPRPRVGGLVTNALMYIHLLRPVCCDPCTITPHRTRWLSQR